MTVFEAFNGYKDDTYIYNGYSFNCRIGPKLESSSVEIGTEYKVHGIAFKRSIRTPYINSDTPIEKIMEELIPKLEKEIVEFERLNNLSLVTEAKAGVSVSCPHCNHQNWLIHNDEEAQYEVKSDTNHLIELGDEVDISLHLSNFYGVEVTCEACNESFLSRFNPIKL
jgi:hypothetical protein